MRAAAMVTAATVLVAWRRLLGATRDIYATSACTPADALGMCDGMDDAAVWAWFLALVACPGAPWLLARIVTLHAARRAALTATLTPEEYTLLVAQAYRCYRDTCSWCAHDSPVAREMCHMLHRALEGVMWTLPWWDRVTPAARAAAAGAGWHPTAEFPDPHHRAIRVFANPDERPYEPTGDRLRATMSIQRAVRRYLARKRLRRRRLVALLLCARRSPAVPEPARAEVEAALARHVPYTLL